MFDEVYEFGAGRDDYAAVPAGDREWRLGRGAG